MKHLGDAAARLLRTYGRFAPTGRGMYRLARGLVRLYGSALPERYLTPWHATLTLDPRTYPDACMAFGVYELETMRLIRRTLRPGDRFVDGGANLGYFTTLAARCVGPAGRVDAFEPEPANRARLLHHLEQNGLDQIVRVHDAALADANGTATIHRNERVNHGAASLFAAQNPTRADHPVGQPDAVDAATAPTASTEVRTVRLDEAIDRPPRLIKLDLEGAEVAALRGARRLLECDDPPWVVCECVPGHLKRAGSSPRELIDTVCAVNPRYEVKVVGGRGVPRALDDASLNRGGERNLLFRTR